MEANTPLKQAGSLSSHLQRTVSRFDVDSLDRAEQKLLALAKRLAVDVRLDVRDYELAETRPEQERLGATARKRLDHLQRTVLQASEHNLFSAIEVAELSAQIDQLRAAVE